MPKDSCVGHVSGYYLEMRRDYVDLFDGDHCAAALAAFFEWATNNELARMRLCKDTGDPWIKASMPKICEETLGLYSIRSLQERLDFLEQNALILVEDKSGIIKRYLLNISLLSRLLSNRHVLRVLDRQNCHPGKIAAPAKPSAELPGDPSKTIGKIAGVRDVYKEESVILSNLQSITPIVPISENSSEERLTSDVDAVHYTDVDEVELPDEAGKSKPQMSTSEIRSFWNQWSRVTMSTPDARAKQRHKHWLSKLRHSDAVTAVNAYRNLATQYDFEDFKKRYSESLRAGISQERATSDPFVKTSPTAGRTSPAAPATPNAQQVAMPGTSIIVIWNELVPSNPLDPPWDWSRDHIPDLVKAAADPVFLENLVKICAKAEALAKTGNKSRDFRWMIKSFGKQAGNWWQFWNQKEAPKFKSQESLEDIGRKFMKERYGSE